MGSRGGALAGGARFVSDCAKRRVTIGQRGSCTTGQRVRQKARYDRTGQGGAWYEVVRTSDAETTTERSVADHVRGRLVRVRNAM